MFEQMAISAAESVAALFIGIVLFLMLFGAVWVRSGIHKQ